MFDSTEHNAQAAADDLSAAHGKPSATPQHGVRPCRPDVPANGNWTVRIERLPIELAVGVHAHERAPQPVHVSLVIKGRAAAQPAGLHDCLDYAPLLDWLTRQWPATPHVDLLESRINELFAQAFGLDHRIDSVWAGLYKQTLCRGAVALGVERGVTRREFDNQRRSAASAETLGRAPVNH